VAPLRQRQRRAQQELDNAGLFSKKDPLKAAVRDAEGRAQAPADRQRAAVARLRAAEERAAEAAPERCRGALAQLPWLDAAEKQRRQRKVGYAAGDLRIAAAAGDGDKVETRLAPAWTPTTRRRCTSWGTRHSSRRHSAVFHRFVPR